MKPLFFLSAAFTALAALGGCATGQNQGGEADPAATLDAAGQTYGDGASKAGNPENCISITQIRSTKVVSDRVIDFEMNGNRVYRNVLPISCPTLANEERFAYRTSVAQLCAIDTITVLRNPGLDRGPTCGLGPFQPVQRPPR